MAVATFATTHALPTIPRRMLPFYEDVGSKAVAYVNRERFREAFAAIAALIQGLQAISPAHDRRDAPVRLFRSRSLGANAEPVPLRGSSTRGGYRELSEQCAKGERGRKTVVRARRHVLQLWNKIGGQWRTNECADEVNLESAELLSKCSRGSHGSREVAPSYSIFAQTVAGGRHAGRIVVEGNALLLPATESTIVKAAACVARGYGTDPRAQRLRVKGGGHWRRSVPMRISTQTCTLLF